MANSSWPGAKFLILKNHNVSGQVMGRKGRPKADTEPVMVRLPSALLILLDDYRREQKDIPTRPEAIRLLLRERLAKLGYAEADK